MSSSAKRNTKPKAPRKAKARPARKRAAPAKKPVEKAVEAPPERKVVAAEKVFLIAVRIMGEFGTPAHVERTLTSLRLNRKFNAVLLEKNANALGTLRQAKDYVTWGEAKSGDIVMLLKERGEPLGGLPMTDRYVKEKFGEQSVDELVSALAQGRIGLDTLWEKGLRPVFRLHPPSGGFSASAKRPYRSRGELGYRGPEISSLLAKMI